MAEDVFGHAIDPAVGYARGAVLSSSAAEMRRVDHAGQVMRERIARLGPDSLGIFTAYGIVALLLIGVFAIVALAGRSLAAATS